MLYRDVRAANKTCLFTSETSDRAEPITPWIYFPIPISQLLGMTAIKGRVIDFLSQPTFTVDKTKPIKMHLFIYLSLECTQSATPDMFVQLHGISRRDPSPHPPRALPWDPFPGKTEPFGFNGIYGRIYCPRAGTAKGCTIPPFQHLPTINSLTLPPIPNLECFKQEWGNKTEH